MAVLFQMISVKVSQTSVMVCIVVSKLFEPVLLSIVESYLMQETAFVLLSDKMQNRSPRHQQIISNKLPDNKN